MSLLVTVTGTVTFGPRTVVPKPPAVDDMAVNGSEKGKEAAKGAGSDDAADREVDFSESFVLVPNWDLVLAKNPPRGLKPWLILTQNYRAL